MSNKIEFQRLEKDVDNSVIEIEEKGDIKEFKIEKDMNLNQDIFYGNSTLKKNPRKIGNTYAFFYKNGVPKVLIGPHWPFYVCLNSIITGLVFLYYYFMWEYLNGMISFFGILIYIIQSISYFLTVVINPGLAKRKVNMKIQDLRNVKICGTCNVVQYPDENIVHCFDCNICIEGYDHHCPWTSKCVGKNNIKVFYVFVSTTMVLFGYLIFSSSTSSKNFS